MDTFIRNYMRAQEAGREDFWADGHIWNVADLQKIKCTPKHVPAHVRASIECRTATPQAKAATRPMSTPNYKALAKATADEFRQKVEELMKTANCDRLTATRLLSEAAGLTATRSEQTNGSWSGRWSQQSREYFRR